MTQGKSPDVIASESLGNQENGSPLMPPTNAPETSGASGGAVFICEICGKVVSTKSALTNHMKTHTAA